MKGFPLRTDHVLSFLYNYFKFYFKTTTEKLWHLQLLHLMNIFVTYSAQEK